MQIEEVKNKKNIISSKSFGKKVQKYMNLKKLFQHTLQELVKSYELRIQELEVFTYF